MVPQRGTNNLNDLGSLIRAMLTTLRRYWTEAEGYQKFAYVIGALLIPGYRPLGALAGVAPISRSRIQQAQEGSSQGSSLAVL